jgi:hypothetical protein
MRAVFQEDISPEHALGVDVADADGDMMLERHGPNIVDANGPATVARDIDEHRCPPGGGYF